MKLFERPFESKNIKRERCHMWGQIADAEFKYQCKRLGLDYYTALSAPLDYIALALEPKGKVH